MSLENKKSNLHTPSQNSRVGRNFSVFGSVFKKPNPISDIEKTAVPVDTGIKSRVSKTIPVDQLPKEVVAEKIELPKVEPVVEEVKIEEIKEIVIDNTVKISSSGSKSTPKF